MTTNEVSQSAAAGELMDSRLHKAQLACEYILDYHQALVQVAKDRVQGSLVKSAMLDELYKRMVTQARLVSGRRKARRAASA